MKYKIFLLVVIILSGCTSIEKKKTVEFIPSDAPIQEIYMTARQFEFTSEIILVKQGTHVILEIESLDVTHGFKLTQYGINVTIPARTKTTVEFYTQEPGTYPFRCAHFCGVGHFGMSGKLIVE